MKADIQTVNAQFSARMQKLLGESDYKRYLAALGEPPERIARKNPLKSVSDELIYSELGGYPMLPASAKPGKGALHAAGAYYVQEPAAAAVSRMIIPFVPERANVLDMCAAPGGKTTALAAARPDCRVLANEIVFSRAKILLSNIERMGLRNCTVTSLRPDEISRRGENLFDAVIADVPCSGEGMLRKTEFGSADLSDECVLACAARSQKILDECDKCLRPGGVLLFSTCTFNLEENENRVFALMNEKGYEPIEPTKRPADSRSGFNLPQAVRFFPQDGGGEGHFACLLKKPDGIAPASKRQKSEKRNSNNKRVAAALDLCQKITLERFDPQRVIILGDGCEYISEDYPYYVFPALRRGMRMADFVNERAVPHHHFATAANAELALFSPDYAPDSPQIAAYLSGNEFDCNQKDGFRILKVASIPLGFIKISDGAAKNKYPKGLRVF